MLVYDSLRLKNTIQVIGLCLYNVGMLIYSSIQYEQIHQAITGLKKTYSPDAHPQPYIEPSSDVWGQIQPFLLAVPIIIAAFTAFMGFVAWKLYDEFAWTIYKHISADLRIKRRFLAFQVSFCSSKLMLWSNRVVDLHFSTKVRFLLLPWLHSTIPRHRYDKARCRVRSDYCCRPYHGAHPVPGCILYSPRK